VSAEPALERSHIGELGLRVDAAQLHPDPPGSPAGMLTAELEGGLHRRRGRRGGSPTGVIAGLQGGGVEIGPRLEGTSHQAPDGAERQVELVGDVRGSRSEPSHPSEGQTQVRIKRAWHSKELPDPVGHQDQGTVSGDGTARNLMSRFRAKLYVA
jgi:hypothetical protein